MAVYTLTAGATYQQAMDSLITKLTELGEIHYLYHQNGNDAVFKLKRFPGTIRIRANFSFNTFFGTNYTGLATVNNEYSIADQASSNVIVNSCTLVATDNTLAWITFNATVQHVVLFGSLANGDKFVLGTGNSAVDECIGFTVVGNPSAKIKTQHLVPAQNYATTTPISESNNYMKSDIYLRNRFGTVNPNKVVGLYGIQKASDNVLTEVRGNDVLINMMRVGINNVYHDVLNHKIVIENGATAYSGYTGVTIPEAPVDESSVPTTGNIVLEMTSDGAPYPYTTTSSTPIYTGNGGCYAWKAFNRATTTNNFFSVQRDASIGNPVFLQIDLRVQRAINNIALTNRPEGTWTNQHPMDWTLQASSDGTNFTTLLTVTGSTGWSPTERRQWTVPSGGIAYRYYKIVITANQSGQAGGAGATSINEVELLNI